MAKGACEGSIGIVDARARMRAAKQAEDRLAFKEAWEALILAQNTHRHMTGCTEEH